MEKFLKNKKIIQVVGSVLALVLVIVILWLTVLKTKAYTVKFDTNGGSDIKAVKVESGSHINLPTPPKKEGEVFVHWLLDDQVVNEKTKVKKNMTLKAVWENDEEEKEQAGKTSSSTQKKSKKKTTSIVYYCESGYKLSGTKCTKEEQKDAEVVKEYVCSDGYHKAGKNCSKEIEKPAKTNCDGENDSVSGDLCVKKDYKDKIIVYYCEDPLDNLNNVDKMCFKSHGHPPVPAKEKRKCPEGYVEYEATQKCFKETKVALELECEHLFILKNGVCKRTISGGSPTLETSYRCEEPYKLSKTKCIKTITVDAKKK